MAEQPDSSQLLENHHSALRLIARFQMPAWLRPKLDPSDLVQQTMLEAHREAARIATMPECERAAYLLILAKQ
jgi:RNA polymerase sigma-70 factor (ECF subfamily)